MKTEMIIYSKTLQLAMIAMSLAFLASCGTSKSNPTNNTSTTFDYLSAKPLASCNKTKDDNFSINTSGATDTTSGQMSTEWIKLKFNFLSSTATASGNTIKFFKWRVVGTGTELDSTPLNFAKYNIGTGQTMGSSVSAMSTAEMSSSNGLYIQLNDPNLQFQVLKAVVYDSAGKIVAQVNTLIPGFYASPLDYKYNSDGTPRADILQKMHALNATDVSGWTQLQIQQYFSQYCF